MSALKPYVGLLIGVGIVVLFAVLGAFGAPIAEHYTEVFVGIAIGSPAGAAAGFAIAASRPQN